MHAARRNIELKARCRDLAAAEGVCRAIGAEARGRLGQTDTYFHVPHGRLKLRENDGDAFDLRCSLIWYDRPTQTAARPSDYTLVPVAEPVALKAALTAALGVRVVVRKTRRLWMWHDVRIHLDDVEGLGSFIEFEAVLAPDDPDALGLQRLAELTGAFSIHPEDQIAESYGELLSRT